MLWRRVENNWRRHVVFSSTSTSSRFQAISTARSRSFVGASERLVVDFLPWTVLLDKCRVCGWLYACRESQSASAVKRNRVKGKGYGSEKEKCAAGCDNERYKGTAARTRKCRLTEDRECKRKKKRTGREGKEKPERRRKRGGREERGEREKGGRENKLKN